MSNLFKISDKISLKYKTAGKISASDISSYLQDSIAKLKNDISVLESKGASKNEILKIIVSELSESKPTSKPEVSGDPEKIFLHYLNELNKIRPGDLFPARELRKVIPLSKEVFDQTAIDLSKKDKIILHHHDFVGNLTEEEKYQLIHNKKYDIYYVGVGAKRDS